MIRVVIVLAMFLLAGCSSEQQQQHHTLSWDTNPESNMESYLVYNCSETPCTNTGNLVATIGHNPSISRHQVEIPNVDQYYVIYAMNNWRMYSGPSETVRCVC